GSRVVTRHHRRWRASRRSAGTTSGREGASTRSPLFGAGRPNHSPVWSTRIRRGTRERTSRTIRLVLPLPVRPVMKYRKVGGGALDIGPTFEDRVYPLFEAVDIAARLFELVEVCRTAPGSDHETGCNVQERGILLPPLPLRGARLRADEPPRRELPDREAIGELVEVAQGHH